MTFIFPYYHLHKSNVESLLGLTNSQVIIQKKYKDNHTISITWDCNIDKLLVGNKTGFDFNSSFIYSTKVDESFFRERDNIVFYGSILNKSFVLWDAWDKYNGNFLDITNAITKYKARELYRGPFSIELLNDYKDCILRFINPRLTYYYVR